MILFTSTFTKTGKDERSELIALLVAILFSLGFLGAFALWYEPEVEEEVWCTAIPVPPARAEVPKLQEPPDPNGKFRLAPETFADVDFANFEYGAYELGEENFYVTLTYGEYTLPWKEGGGGDTFDLKDVFYTDVTGDGKPEAIVILTHVQCGGSCDGGSHLFYVYQSGKRGFRRIWMYATGSTAYGCGLKSMTVTNKTIELEMFGQCWKPASSFETSGKFMVRDLTRSEFKFNGRRFVKRSTKVTAAPVQDVKNYTADIHIQEK